MKPWLVGIMYFCSQVTSHSGSRTSRATKYILHTFANTMNWFAYVRCAFYSFRNHSLKCVDICTQVNYQFDKKKNTRRRNMMCTAHSETFPPAFHFFEFIKASSTSAILVIAVCRQYSSMFLCSHSRDHSLSPTTLAISKIIIRNWKKNQIVEITHIALVVPHAARFFIEQLKWTDNVWGMSDEPMANDWLTQHHNHQFSYVESRQWRTTHQFNCTFWVEMARTENAYQELIVFTEVKISIFSQQLSKLLNGFGTSFGRFIQFSFSDFTSFSV